MKIYFEDGEISNYTPLVDGIIIDARYGFYDNYRRLKLIDDSKDSDAVVYTNSLVALDNDWCWNEKEHRPELYFRDIAGVWKNCTELTDKEIRRAHNLEKMYIAGSFKTLLKDTWNV